MGLFKKKNSSTAPVIFDQQGLLPNHVAIIMDGNGRWAQKRLMPRIAGHKEGMQVVKRIALYANKLGINVLSLYAFSTENWKRPSDEVSFLMKLPVEFFSTFIPELNENNIRVTTTGFIEALPDHTRKAVLDAQQQTANNTGLILNFALNYGARAELLEAVHHVALAYHQGQCTEEQLRDPAFFAQHLQTAPLAELAEPDLLIRTSGEQRLSNFMLWQAAYSELYFTEVHWPDFTTEHFAQALGTYQQRNRRFGGV